MKATPERLKGLSILVVDDWPEITSLVADVLTEAGASVASTNSGTDAILRTTVTKYDVLVLDIGMPQPDGLKVIEFLKAANPRLFKRTLVLTGRKFDKHAMSVLVGLGVPVLLKPFQLDELVNAVLRLSLLERTQAATA